jgi:hypothetical protein
MHFLKPHYDTEGPFGLPMKDAQAQALEVIINTLPQPAEPKFVTLDKHESTKKRKHEKGGRDQRTMRLTARVGALEVEKSPEVEKTPGLDEFALDVNAVGRARWFGNFRPNPKKRDRAPPMASRWEFVQNGNGKRRTILGA